MILHVWFDSPFLINVWTIVLMDAHLPFNDYCILVIVQTSFRTQILNCKGAVFLLFCKVPYLTSIRSVAGFKRYVLFQGVVRNADMFPAGGFIVVVGYRFNRIVQPDKKDRAVTYFSNDSRVGTACEGIF